MNNPTLVIMAAGMGSRFGGLKQIEPVGANGEIIIDYSLYDAHKAGFKKVVFIIKRELLQIFEETIGKRAKKLMQVEYAFQEIDTLPNDLKCPEGREKPFGTGHAIWCAKDVVSEPFCVINADDFYGREAFQQAYNYLLNVALPSESDPISHFCLIGYNIENTMTENGSVTRGVCVVDQNNYLTSVTERFRIEYRDSGKKIVFIEDDKEELIPFATPVSMNMWGLLPGFFQDIEVGLYEYFSHKIPINPLKAEYLLPVFIDKLIKDNKADTKVIQTNSKWYGVTYKEDKDSVVKAIRELTQKGEYPEKL